MHEIDILIKVLFQSTFNGKGMKCGMQFENELWFAITSAKLSKDAIRKFIKMIKYF